MKIQTISFIIFLTFILYFVVKSIVIKKYMNTKPIIETYVGNLRVANEIDDKRATKYAMRKFCEMGGYKCVQGPEEFTYDCQHTKATCEGESIYPTPKLSDAVPQYYEWRDNTTKEYKDYANQDKIYQISQTLSGGTSSEPLTNPDGICIIGNESFRSFCEKEHLKYNTSNGNCLTTKKYCNDRLLAYCNGDCYETPTGVTLRQVVGVTLSRSNPFVLREFLAAQAICDVTGRSK